MIFEKSWKSLQILTFLENPYFWVKSMLFDEMHDTVSKNMWFFNKNVVFSLGEWLKTSEVNAQATGHSGDLSPPYRYHHGGHRVSKTPKNRPKSIFGTFFADPGRLGSRPARAGQISGILGVWLMEMASAIDVVGRDHELPKKNLQYIRFSSLKRIFKPKIDDCFF